MTPFGQPGWQSISLAGPAIMLSPNLALSFGVTDFDELATNAVGEFGALSPPSGRIAVDWSISGAEGETRAVAVADLAGEGGPPVAPPTKSGFRIRLIQREVEHSHSGAARNDFAEGGLSARFEFRCPPRRKNSHDDAGASPSRRRKRIANEPIASPCGEDSALLLFGVELLLSQRDIEIVGAAGTLSVLRKLAGSVAADVAILDVNLNGEMVFPVADLLIERGVPIVFTTGYAPEKIFPRM